MTSQLKHYKHCEAQLQVITYDAIAQTSANILDVRSPVCIVKILYLKMDYWRRAQTSLRSAGLQPADLLLILLFLPHYY